MSKLKRIVLACGFLLFNSWRIFAQIDNGSIGARSAGLGGVSATLSDLWSTNNNQAGLGFINNFSGGINYENRFLLKETSFRSMTIVVPVKLGAFGINIDAFGFEMYNETKFGLSYGQKFGENFSIGVQLNYLKTQLTKEFGNKQSLIGAIGLIAILNEELSLGVHIYNPTRNKLAEFDNERISTIMKLGLEYQFSRKVMLVVETENNIDFNMRLRIGLEYYVADLLYFRGGVFNNPNQSSFGLGLKLKNTKIDVSSSFHPTLGVIPSISIIYKKEK